MKALVVDDARMISETIKDVLEMASFTVDVATDSIYGMELAIYNLKEYDVILLDWMLPGINGLDICKRIRAHNAEIPVIFLTANQSSEDAVSAFEAGATDFIHKPFAPDELLARIHVILRNSPHRKDRQLYS